MTRKLPADMPSPEERGAHRPDEPEKGKEFVYTPPKLTYGGILGVTAEHPAALTGLERQEIERRILAIEETMERRIAAVDALVRSKFQAPSKIAGEPYDDYMHRLVQAFEDWANG